MKKILTSLCLQLVVNHVLLAQSPHLQGKVKISILNGTIDGNIEVSNVPNLEDYSIRLNSGLNIKYFRDSTDAFNFKNAKFYDDEKSSETFQYVLGNNTGKILPQKFTVNYSGKFPVVSDTLRASNGGDFKGNLAFNGMSLRASEQTAWYPILYDVKNDVILDKVTYDLQVTCEDCKSLYLNGSRPQKATSARFKSDKSVQLMLFVGNFDFENNNKLSFINTNLSAQQQTVLGNWTERIIKFYESKFKVPYSIDLTYIYTPPISKKNNWAFVTLPTVTFIAPEQYSIRNEFKGATNILKDSNRIQYLAHELGHYYFGSVFVPNSTLKWAFLEGLTEYVALKTVQSILGETFYRQKMQAYFSEITDLKPTALSNITQPNDINETYRYYYVPLLITALEKEMGEERVWRWFQTLLNTNKLAKTDYLFLKETLLKSGISELEFNEFEKKYITANDAKANVLNIVKL